MTRKILCTYVLTSRQAQRRPLFLIGHSFGGTIIASVGNIISL